jgi:hypothetical protein
LPELEVLEDRLAPNQIPLAINDFFTIDEDDILEAFAPGVLDNDSDPDSDPLTAELVDGPASGQLTFNANGSFTYTPEANFHGQVTFTYRAFDGTDWSEFATVTITINPVNDAPFAVDDWILADYETPLTISALGNDFDVDGDSLSIVSHTPPSHGTLTLNQNQTFTYTPTLGQSADDSFTYTIADPSGATSTATVDIVVGPAFPDDVTTEEDTPVTIDVLANDGGEDPGALTVLSVTSAEHGTVVLNPDDTITYTPNANWYGQDSFEYTMENEDEVTDTATVTVTVVWVNDAPVALDDEFSVTEDAGLSYDILTNDSDIDDDDLIVVGLSDALHGRIEYMGNGLVSYTPNGDFNSLDGQGNLTILEEIEYTIWDGVDATDTGMIRITVNPVNDVPLAYHDAFQHGWAPGTPPPELSIPFESLLDNDIDYDSSSGSVGGAVIHVGSHDTTGLNGTLERDEENERFVFEPSGYGWTSFTYTAADGQNGESEPATVWINVLPFIPATGGGPWPDFYVNPDEYYLGAEAISGSVTTNDAGWSKIILSAPPSWGRLSPFAVDGSFTYTPDAVVAGVHTLGYTAFASDGRTQQGTLTSREPQPWLQGYTLAVYANPRDPVGKFETIAMNSRPGLYVHWNIDNDNRNVQAGKDLQNRWLKDANGNDAAPKPDYGDTTAPVANEDDLLPLLAIVQNVEREGIVTLKRDSANIRVWRTYDKGAGNEILVTNDEKSWNLANPSEYDDFRSFWPTPPPTQYYYDAKLWVEGFGDAKNGDGKANLRLTYTPPPTKGNSTSRSIDYTFFGAGTGRQPTPFERDSIKGQFPRLIDCEWSITDEPTLAPPGWPNPPGLPPGTNTQPRSDGLFYNCFAWTIEEQRKWWDDQPLPADPALAMWFRVMRDQDRVITDAEIGRFYEVLSRKGWKPIGKRNDNRAITYWGPSQFGIMNNSHGARNMGRTMADGNLDLYESKLGKWQRIEHVPEQLEGGTYGDMHLYFK